MRRQYSEKDFTQIAAHVELPQGVRNRMHTTYTQILQESRNTAMNGAIVRPIRCALLVALCLCVLATGALAVYLSTNTDFFATVFGRPSVDAVTQLDEDGNITSNIPSMQREPVDGEKAQSLIGAYMDAPPESYRLQTHMGPLTVDILGNVYDHATGTGMLALTLERESGGFPELAGFDTGGAHFSGKGLRLNVARGEAIYLDNTQSTANKVYLSVAYIQLDDTPPELSLFEVIPLSEVDASELTAKNTGEEDAYFELLHLSLAQEQDLPSLSAPYEGQQAVFVSSVGLKLDLAALGFYNGADDYEVKTISLRFRDGSTYQMMDREARLANYEYALIPEDGSFATYCFNRPVDIADIQSIQINTPQVIFPE